MMRFQEFEALGVRCAAISDKSDDDCVVNPADAVSARAPFLALCGISEEALVLARQVHGCRVASVGREDAGRGGLSPKTAIADTDGLITNVPGLALGIRVADCVPVFLYDSVCKAIGLVHAGRVGTFLNISAAAVAALERELGASPGRIHAIIGPSAGPEAYEVSPSIAEEFSQAGLPVKGRFLDLWQANVEQLVASGVPGAQISVSGECTITGGRFHSHRANPDGRRNLAILIL